MNKKERMYVLKPTDIKKVLDEIYGFNEIEQKEIEGAIEKVQDKEPGVSLTEIPRNKVIRIAEGSMIFVQITDFRELMLFSQYEDVYEVAEEEDGTTRIVLSCINRHDDLKNIGLYHIIEQVESINSPFYVPIDDYMEEIRSDGYTKTFETR